MTHVFPRVSLWRILILGSHDVGRSPCRFSLPAAAIRVAPILSAYGLPAQLTVSAPLPCSLLMPCRGCPFLELTPAVSFCGLCRHYAPMTGIPSHLPSERTLSDDALPSSILSSSLQPCFAVRPGFNFCFSDGCSPSAACRSSHLIFCCPCQARGNLIAYFS